MPVLPACQQHTYGRNGQMKQPRASVVMVGRTLARRHPAAEKNRLPAKRHLAGPNLLHQQVGSRASEIALRARKRPITGSRIFFERRR